MPLVFSLRPALFSRFTFNPNSSSSKVVSKTVLYLNSTIAMADQDEPTSSSRIDPTTPQKYPVPLSPQLPPISKQIELNRAMSASSKSSLFALSRTDILYEDEWLIAVNKPQGIYCESVLSSVAPSLAQVSHSDGLAEGLSNFSFSSNCWMGQHWCSDWLVCWVWADGFVGMLNLLDFLFY